MKYFNKKLLLFSSLLLLVLSLSADAQRGSERILMCNERNSVHDRLSFPGDAGVIKSRNGAVRFLEWRGLIGNQKGNYKLRISSYSNFGYKIQRRNKTKNARWQTVANGRSAIPATSGGNKFFKFDRLFTSSGFFSNGYQLAIFVYPQASRTNVSISWYTSACERSKPQPGSNKCFWDERGAIFGIPGSGYWVCVCGGKTANDKRCGPKPRKRSFLKLLDFTPPNINFSSLIKEKATS